MELTKEQSSIHDEVLKLCHNNRNKHVTISISGSAGTGKTVLLSELVRSLRGQFNIEVACPTNKSAQVLEEKDISAITIHKLLGLTLNVKLSNYDDKNRQFTETKQPKIPAKGIVFIDECSMVNQYLNRKIRKICEKQKTIVVFIGDKLQLAPVGEYTCSETFKCDYQFKLEQVIRQSNDNQLMDTIESLKTAPMTRFPEFLTGNGLLLSYDMWRPFINDNIWLFKTMLSVRDDSIVRLLAFTNKRVEAFNDAIREQLGFKEEYVPGEFVMMYDSNGGLMNSQGVFIESASKTVKDIVGVKMDCWLLTSDDDESIWVLSKNNPMESFKKLAKNLMDAQQNAIITGKWNTFFRKLESFCSPFDLIYNGGIIKRKSIDYGYCMSVHKSQGSTYQNVMLDITNILTARDKEMVRQLEYVGFTRTSRNVMVLQ